MRRFTFGALDNRFPQETKTLVEADDYEIGDGFVSFIRDGKKFLSLPFSKVGVVAELTDDNDLPFTNAT